MDEPTHGLSVVMIAKNSQQYLPVVLRSLRDVADEIVLVDTGSTDTTLEIAGKHGCRIFEFPWCNDFAVAKNFGIKQARFSWILNVDTDEALYDKKAKSLLASALKDDSVPAYIIWLDNLFDSGLMTPAKGLRLFRNDLRIRFSNPVHESIGESLYANWPTFIPPVLNLHLRHYGYLSRNAQGKHERNIAMMRRWTASEPDNIFANYKLGTTLCEAGWKEEALPYLEKTFDLFAGSNDRGSYPFLTIFIGEYFDLLVAMGNEGRALQVKMIAMGWQ
jgi:glycosyltransferase involved in cell wall biosynthesis